MISSNIVIVLGLFLNKLWICNFSNGLACLERKNDEINLFNSLLILFGLAFCFFTGLVPF